MRRAVGPAARTGGGDAVATHAASAAASAVAIDAGPTRALIWRLQSGGWTSVQAGNLAAISMGLRPARNGWTGAELDHLRFLKSLVSTGRIEH
jgi:hypothetical protein